MRLAIITALLLGFPASLHGQVAKVALLIGNNQGEAGEVQLLYAHKDVGKVAGVLRRHGGFRAEDLTQVIEGNAGEVRSALVTINDRIRSLVQDSQREVLFFVYYSGHADSEYLHLGDTSLPVEEFRKMVRGSAAKFRVLVLDSCKSGSLTRVKGGRPVVPFDVNIEHELGSEGTVMITSSAFDEDAQESDRYRGSLFTHHFVSGLLGAADLSADGRVTLMEVYQYAYEQTIKTTSRTWAGTQHPTYKYDTKGKGDLVLTTLTLDGRDKASLEFTRPGEYLLMRRHADGPVVAEVASARPGRRLLLEPGTYFIRERRSDELREGEMKLRPGVRHSIEEWNYERIAYARLVRKGAGLRAMAHGPLISYRFRGEILSDMGPMHLFGLGYPLSFRYLSVTPRMSLGRSTAGNDTLRSFTTEVDLVLDVTYALDWSIFTVAVGLELGGVYLGQRFETEGQAQGRDQFGLIFGGVTTLSVSILQEFYLQISAEARTYLLSRQTDSGDGQIETPLTYVFGVSAGMNF